MNILLDACMIDESTQDGGVRMENGPESFPRSEYHSDAGYGMSPTALQALVAPGEMTHELVVKYGALWAGIDSEECPQELGEYLLITNRAEKIRADRRLIHGLLERVDRSSFLSAHTELLFASNRIKNHLNLIEKPLMEIKQACWKSGFDVGAIDQRFVESGSSEMRSARSELERGEKEKCENLIHTWQDVLQEKGLGAWATTNDRINSWLLQTLAASQEE
jgi:hypothetical protein